MRTIRIAGRAIGPDQPPFVIAELSANHNGSLARALQLVEAAARSGARAVKLQTQTPDGLTLDVDAPPFRIDDPASPWHGRTLHDLYQEAHTPWEWHAAIFERCGELGLVCFSAPFEAEAVTFLEGLGAPAYKIASFENADLPLIRRVAATGKPLILSTGMATLAELHEALETARQAGCDDILLLRCTSSYPASPAESDLATIPHLRELFGLQVGLSDHTLGVGVAVAGVALGATVIEKHLTLRRADGGVDAAFSLEPDEFRALVVETERAWRALGRVRYGPTEAELPSLKGRRSLYLARDVGEGEALTADNVRAVRPGDGLSPKYYEAVLGKHLKRAAPRGTPLTWELLA